MFKRRDNPGTWSKVSNWFWPRPGWRRAFRYFGHRLGRLQDTPYRIAAGLACGIAVSLTPFIGLHVIIAIAIAFAIRSNLIAAALGTLFGNPLTFPLIWALSYQMGSLIMGTEATGALKEIISSGNIFTRPFDAFGPILIQMTIGAIFFGVLAWPLAYYPVKRLVARMQKERAERIKKRQRDAHKESGAK